MAAQELRGTMDRPEPHPLVSPNGRFVFSMKARNLGDGLTTVERVDGRLVATLTAAARRRGYREIHEMADSPEQAQELYDGLVDAFMQRGGAAIPDDLVPEAVKALRVEKKAEKRPFKRSSEPKSAKPAAKAKKD